MNTYNINDESYKNSEEYQNFLKDNPEIGYLKIRAYAASGAVPVSGVGIVVSKDINNNKVIFYKGLTNESGVIEKIELPAPKLDPNDLDIPNKITYDIKATYSPNNTNTIFKVNIYEKIRVIQNISIVPELMVIKGDL